MATDEKWYFTKEQLANTPSRKCGIDGDKELSYRQQAANLIQDMGQRLMVSQLCINTAIVYMHRFYVFHSLTHFHRNSMASAALFLAAKVEEQPRKLEHVIKVAYMCLHKDLPHPQQQLDPKSDQYHELAQDLVCNENVLLQTLGFDVAIDHPHTHVVRCCHLVKASKDLAQTSYFMASNSLHLTTMCLQYKPTIVACFCIHLACKWSNWEIPQSNEGKDWFWYVDKSVTSELLGQLTGEFLHIFDKCPSRLKRKIRSISANQSPNITPSQSIKSPFDVEPRKVLSPANSEGNPMFSLGRSETDASKKSGTSQSSRTVDYREYREKKERERLEREKASANAAAPSSSNADPNKSHHSHHHKQSSSGMNMPGKHSSSSSTMKQVAHHNHHHNSSRQDVKSSSQMVQRHSSSGSNSSSGSGVAREMLREKQRLQREYSNLSSSGYSSHNHSLDNLLESSLLQDSQTAHPPEKLNNVIHKAHGNDSRHGKQHQKDTKLYAKYADPATAKTSRKDPIEHRTEEVRKLIEKPLPPPTKPRPEVLVEEYAAMMLKSSHQSSKYQQPEKPTPSSVSTSQASLPSLGPEPKMMNVGQTAFTTEKSPNPPVSAAQISQKSQSASKNSQAKNGNVSATSSFSLVNNYEEPKVEKKPREENANMSIKHRSLFSPDKTIAPHNAKESHSQRLKQKQRTSPVVPKQENHLSASSANAQVDPTKQRPTNNSTSVSSQKQQRLNAESINIHDHDSKQQDNHSRRLGTGFSLPDAPGLSGNRVPELIQPIKDNLSSNKTVHTDVKLTPESANQRLKSQQSQILSNGLHPSLVKQDCSLMDSSSFVVKQEPPEELLSNEMPSDFGFPKQEQKNNYLSYQDAKVKLEQLGIKQEVGVKQEPSTRQNSFSPLKTAQSISALLQENLGSMSPILQVPSYEQQSQPSEEEKEPQLPSTVDMSELAAPIHCAIEIPVMTTSASASVPSSSSVVTSVPVAEEKKSEHHSKSEKKKKEKKHKHKEKDKSKEKHKHKHKEKDKDKHRRDKGEREKDNKTDDGSNASGNSTALAAAPIKITIPKDKLNLSADSIGTSASSATPSSGLKIKIPKERLKGGDVAAQQLQQSQAQQQQQQQQQPRTAQPQAPLKIKIRTDALARNASGELKSPAGKLLQQQQQQQQQQPEVANRKRERSETMENSALLGAPPNKKLQSQHHQQQQQQQFLQQQQQLQQQQRLNERQNGRHGSYNMPGNNKPERLYDVDVSSGEAVEGHPKNFVPTSYGSFPNYYY